MILNAKNNQFKIILPRKFFSEEVEKKYGFYLKRLPTPFESITDFTNHTIQSVNFPGVSSDLVEQWVGRRVEVDGKQVTKNPQYWRQAADLDRVIPKEFTINFKAADAYLNYWALFEQFRIYLSIPNEEDYIPDFQLIYLDREGYQILTILLKQPIIKGISEVEMNYSSAAMEFKTFSMNIGYNTFEIDVKLD